MTAIEIYNVLVDAGIEKEKAKEVSKMIVTQDLLDDSIDRLTEKMDYKFNIMFGLHLTTLALIMGQYFIG